MYSNDAVPIALPKLSDTASSLEQRHKNVTLYTETRSRCIRSFLLFQTSHGDLYNRPGQKWPLAKNWRQMVQILFLYLRAYNIATLGFTNFFLNKHYRHISL